MKRSKRRVILISLAVVVVGLIGAEVFISRSIGRKLANTLQERANAELTYDSAWYIPPYGLKLTGVRVKRDAADVLTVARLAVKLDRIPRPHQQLVINSIDIDAPVVRISRATSRPSHPHKESEPKQKLSTLFKLTQLRINSGEVRDERGDEPMVWKNINVDVDTTQQSDAKYTFALNAKDGAIFELKTAGDFDVDELLLNLNEFDLHAKHDVAHPSDALPAAMEKVLRKNGLGGEVTITLAGRISKADWSLPKLRASGDFKEFGSIDIVGSAAGPTDLQGKNWWEAIEHDFTLKPHDLSLRPKGFQFYVRRINGEPARFTGGVVQFHNLAAHYAEDQLELRGARLDLKELPKIAFREIDSTVNFAGAHTQYSPKLTKVIERLQPVGPFVIGGDFITIPGPPPSEYDLRISSDTGSLNLFDGRIGLSKVHGDACLTRGKLEGQNITADIFGGDATISGMYEWGDAQAYRGHLTLRKVDLLQVAAVYGESSRRLRGRGFLDADFDSLSSAIDLNALSAKGEVEVLDGEFFELPVLKELLGATKPTRKAATAGEAGALFEIKEKVVHLRRAAINAPILGLQGGGDIGFNGHLKLEVVAAPLADWRDNMKKGNIPIVSDVAGEIAGGVQRLLNATTGTLFYQFRVDQTVHDPRITTVPVPVLNDAAAALFGRMLKEKKSDERVVDYLKAEQ